MLLKVKPLSKPEQDVQVDGKATISELLTVLHQTMGIDPASSRLVFKGCPLLDGTKSLAQYDVNDGDKLTLISKPISAQPQKPKFENLLRSYLSESYDGDRVESIVAKFMHILSDRIDSMSLDDIERLAGAWLQTDQ